jgi:hypothetical protein
MIILIEYLQLGSFHVNTYEDEEFASNITSLDLECIVIIVHLL